MAVKQSGKAFIEILSPIIYDVKVLSPYEIKKFKREENQYMVDSDFINLMTTSLKIEMNENTKQSIV